jgi:GT2 family glycosyltransferase
MSKVSIIVVNYNGREIVGACLEALLRQSYEAREVIVVDNSSCDGSLHEIQKIMKKDSTDSFKLISLNENIGFAGANLEGLKYFNGEYIALLNPDATADSFWLGELVNAMESRPEVGICASKMIANGSNVIDSAGDGYSTTLKGFKKGEGLESEQFSRQEYVFGACAGAALYRKRMIEEIGFLDKDFFLIHEDTDLNFRSQLAGWKVCYVPTAIVYHKVRSSIGKMSDMAMYYTLRNSELVRVKNIPLGVFIRCFPGFLLGELTEFLFFAVKHRRLKLYFKAKIDAIRMLPKMLKKRKSVLKNRKVSNKYLLNIMTPVWRKDFLVTKIKKFLHE